MASFLFSNPNSNVILNYVNTTITTLFFFLSPLPFPCISFLNQIMGSCISKCRPNKHSLNHFNKDKLVISHQPPPTPTTLLHSSNKISPSPPSPTSSISSFTCTTSKTISSASSFSSTNSSSLSSKDRSFSNDFLWSCYKENPHIITRINSLTKPTPQPKKIINPSPTKQNMPLKRMRSNSPTNLTRQKSFRKEVEPQLPLRPNRMLGSPSPSRRFNGSVVSTTISDNSVSKRMSNSPKASVAHSSRSVNSTSIRKESVRAAAISPNNSLRRVRSSGLSLRHRETVVKDVISGNHHNIDSIMEDIDNPLISLDCFIFL